MKYCFLLSVAILFQLLSYGQKLSTGTYIFNFCDLEYHSCVSTCRVVIKGDSITVYATKSWLKTGLLLKKEI